MFLDNEMVNKNALQYKFSVHETLNESLDGDHRHKLALAPDQDWVVVAGVLNTHFHSLKQ